MALAEPAQALLSAVVAAIPGWIERSVARVLRNQGLAFGPDVRAATARAGAQAAATVEEQLATLLSRDVDDQRTNPLAVLRASIRYPTAVLRAAGAAPVQRDEFQRQRFPDDEFDLVPATWSDIDPGLHEPGITWGAWKAMAVLDRRRAEGRR